MALEVGIRSQINKVDTECLSLVEWLEESDIDYNSKIHELVDALHQMNELITEVQENQGWI